METKSMFRALAAAFLVYFLYILLIQWIWPSRPAPTQATRQDVSTVQPGAAAPAALPSPESGPAFTPASPLSTPWRVQGGPERRTTTLGGAGTPLALTLDSRGAAVQQVRFTARQGDRYVHRTAPGVDEPFTLLNDRAGALPSFATGRLWVAPLHAEPIDLASVDWAQLESVAGSAVFHLLIDDGAGQPIFEVIKTYALDSARPLVQISIELVNRTSQALEIKLEQDAGTGATRETEMYDVRHLIVARKNGGAVSAEIVSAGTQPNRVGASSDTPPLLWTALTNRYFVILTRPVQPGGGAAKFIEDASAWRGLAQAQPDGDTIVRYRTLPRKVDAGGRTSFEFEVYAGPKDAAEIAKLGEPTSSVGGFGYVMVRVADAACCTFEPLTDLMTWLLGTIHAVVRNYGVAIILLVIMVRGLLHPLTVFQQKSMFRMQEMQGRLAPKVEEIKVRCGSDRARLNKEMLELYAKEGINPLAPMLGMLPLFLQMPIMVSLWTALNTDVHLRHAPFDGWWIRDLSAPDMLIAFGAGGWTIPLLGDLPLIGSAFRNISGLNLLPILMGVSMYLQQKYMPKPHQQARRDAASNAPPKKDALGMTPEEAMRQQQLVATMMSIMLPIFFYYMPSGLTLYWLSTNVVGILESLRIRKQIEQEKQKRASQPVVASLPRKPGAVSKLLRSLAKQAEEVQKKADQLSAEKPQRRPGKNS